MLAFQHGEKAHRPLAPSGGTTEIVGVQCPRRRLLLEGYSDSVATTILHSRRDSTNKVYQPHITSWERYCHTNGHDVIKSTVPIVLGFLHTLLDDKLGFSSLNIAKSAINTCVILPEGQHLGTNADVKAFM